MLKAWLKPWLEEVYTVIGNIEGKLANLQAMQQKLQADSARAVIEKTFEDPKQAAAHCITEVVVIRVKLDELRANIFVPTK